MNLSLIMRKRSIVKRVFVFSALLFTLGSCKEKVGIKQHHNDPYTLEIDSTLTDLLLPTNREIVSTLPTIKARSGMQLFSVDLAGRIDYDTKNQVSIASRVEGRIERLHVKYNYQPVRKGEVIMEIYSPDLVSTQREILMLASSDGEGDLLNRAKQRLFLLGMTSAQVERLIKTKEVNYRIPIYSNASGYLIEKLATTNLANTSSADETSAVTNNTPMLFREGQYVKAGETLFTIYQADGLLAELSIPPSLARFVKTETSILIQSADVNDVVKAKIDVIQPYLKNGEYFSMAKVFLSKSGIRPGQLVKVHVPVLIKEGWWLPKKAVWMSGVDAIVFKKENSVFLPKYVKVGTSVNEKVQILEDISDWDVASNAYYLIDSESFVRPKPINE